MQKRKYIKTKLLRDYLKINNMTKLEFCKKFNIDIKEMKMFFDDNKFTELRTLVVISKAIGIRLYELVY